MNIIILVSGHLKVARLVLSGGSVVRSASASAIIFIRLPLWLARDLFLEVKSAIFLHV